MRELSGFAVGTGSAIGIRLAGAPWWAVVLVMLVVSSVFLVALHMTYKHVYRLASLAHTGSVKGAGGIEWKASSQPEDPQPKEPETPKPKRWRRHKPPDSSEAALPAKASLRLYSRHQRHLDETEYHHE